MEFPWDEWFDGKIHCITRGEDFETSVINFRAGLMIKAKNRGLGCKTEVDQKLQKIYFFTYPKNLYSGGLQAIFEELHDFDIRLTS